VYKSSIVNESQVLSFIYIQESAVENTAFISGSMYISLKNIENAGIKYFAIYSQEEEILAQSCLAGIEKKFSSGIFQPSSIAFNEYVLISLSSLNIVAIIA